MSDHLDHLARVSLFAGADRKELGEIAKLTTELPLAAGSTLVQQGDLGREAFVVVEGEAVASIDGSEVAVLGPGDCIGEIALLDKGPRSATVVARTDMSVLVLDPREFKGLLLQVPAIAIKVATALAERVRVLDSKLYG